MQLFRIRARAASSSGPRPACQPRRLQRGRRHVVYATAAPAVPYKPIPQVKGGLPWLGPMFPLDGLPWHIEQEWNKSGARCLDYLMFGKHAIYLRHPEDVAMVARKPEKFLKTQGMNRSDKWLGSGLVTELDNAKHAEARQMLAPAFAAQSVKDQVACFAGVAHELIDTIMSRPDEPVELEPLTRRATLDVIGRAGFGYNFKALQQVQQRLTGERVDDNYIDVVKIYEDILTPAMLLAFDVPLPDFMIPGYGSYVKGVEQLEVVVQQVLQDRRTHGISADDRSLLSFMLAAQQADPDGIVTDKHIRDQLMTFTLAGSDTTASTLAFCLHEIAQRPGVLATVQQELQQALGDKPADQLDADAFQSLPYLTGCINETLRLFPAAVATARLAARDEVCGEHLVPAGSILILDIYNLHRNPHFWPRATEWLPERWMPNKQSSLGPQHPNAFQPFSVGPRSCIGRYFALLEMQVILGFLLRQVSLKPCPDKPREVKLLQSFTLKSKDGLFVQAERR
eukprot:GHRR01001514.1.p1 GENE.GHRR01001514.1~~GHRR01001514.1.p1  ORF type:complete len:511 (+),score=138.65 GHRR01001514.1:235-1767(+)